MMYRSLLRKIGEEIWHSHHGWGKVLGYACEVSGEPIYLARFKDGDFYVHVI